MKNFDIVTYRLHLHGEMKYGVYFENSIVEEIGEKEQFLDYIRLGCRTKSELLKNKNTPIKLLPDEIYRIKSKTMEVVKTIPLKQSIKDIYNTGNVEEFILAKQQELNDLLNMYVPTNKQKKDIINNLMNQAVNYPRP